MDMSLTSAIKGTILVSHHRHSCTSVESSNISKYSSALRPNDPTWDLYLGLFLTFFIFLQKSLVWPSILQKVQKRGLLPPLEPFPRPFPLSFEAFPLPCRFCPFPCPFEVMSNAGLELRRVDNGAFSLGYLGALAVLGSLPLLKQTDVLCVWSIFWAMQYAVVHFLCSLTKR